MAVSDAELIGAWMEVLALSDLRRALGEFPVGEEYGFVDAPGRWDHWPSGFVFTFADARRTCACHMDIPMRHCTVRLDGVDVVTSGRCVPQVPAPTK